MKQVPVKRYDRTCGYYADQDNVNPGKAEEVKERKRFDVKKIPEILEKNLTFQNI